MIPEVITMIDSGELNKHKKAGMLSGHRVESINLDRDRAVAFPCDNANQDPIGTDLFGKAPWGMVMKSARVPQGKIAISITPIEKVENPVDITRSFKEFWDKVLNLEAQSPKYRSLDAPIKVSF